MPLMVHSVVDVAVESSGEDDYGHDMYAEFGGREINALRWREILTSLDRLVET